MAALVSPPCTTSITDGLCVFPCFSVPRSIAIVSTIPRARAINSVLIPTHYTVHINKNIYTGIYQSR
jgi:hypothetical protein